MSSPVRAQYLHLKSLAPDAILFFRLGDFYEMFDDDAVVGARELELTLTSREFAKGERAPLCGVPYHAAETYITRLVAKGLKVAISEQIGDPRLARGLVDREIVRVATPGTAVEGGLLDPKRNRYLAAAILQGEEGAVAYADSSTGEIQVVNFHGSSSGSTALAAVERELARIDPAEVLWPHDEESDVPAPRETYVTLFDRAHFSLAAAERCVKDHYGLTSLAQEPYAAAPLALSAAGALLAYLGETQRALLPQLRPIRLLSAEETMILDAPTRRNLEIDHTIRSGASQGSLLGIIDRTKTAMGARLLRRWITSPLIHLAPLEARLTAVQTLVTQTAARMRLASSCGQLGDIERLTGRILQGTATPRDLLALAQTLARVGELKSIAKTYTEVSETDALSQVASDPMPHPETAPSLPELVRSLDDCEGVRRLIERAIVDEPPALVGSGFFIRTGYSEELDRIEASVAEARAWMAALETRERERTGIRSLKVSFNKVFGYSIEVSNANRSTLPGEYIRKQTLVSAERYITPELKEKEALILSADERRSALELSLLRRLRDEVAPYAGRLLRIAGAVAALDVYLSLAIVATDHEYVRPELDNESRIRIEEGRHPVVEAVQRETRFIPNSVTLDTKNEQILILTGPNMSGKSCFLRQTALIVLLAQIGSFVPATRAKIGLVDRIYTRVGAQDDIATGHSTFMVEMVETASILLSCTERSLLILDEVGRGTSTYDGVAIAQAIVEYLHAEPRRAARTIFATHYHELNLLAERLPRVRNWRMNVLEEGDDVVFLRTVAAGGADKSYGIHVAKLAGIPTQVIARAAQVLHELEEVKRRDGSTGQLQLFPPAPHASPDRSIDLENNEQAAVDEIVAQLRLIDPDDMTPRDALALLARLRDEARALSR